MDAALNMIMRMRYQPGVFDCYDMVAAAQRMVFGREVPDFALRGVAGVSAALSAGIAQFGWYPTKTPKHGDIAILKLRLSKVPHHIGVYFSGPPAILHCDMDCQVQLDPLDQIERGRRFVIHEYLTPA